MNEYIPELIVELNKVIQRYGHTVESFAFEVPSIKCHSNSIDMIKYINSRNIITLNTRKMSEVERLIADAPITKDI